MVVVADVLGNVICLLVLFFQRVLGRATDGFRSMAFRKWDFEGGGVWVWIIYVSGTQKDTPATFKGLLDWSSPLHRKDGRMERNDGNPA